MSKIFENILGSLSNDVRRYIELSDDIAEHIHYVLEERGMSQKDLAEVLGKKESEISKWLSGKHNFTLKSISKIESALGIDLLYTGNKIKEINLPIEITWSVSVSDIYEGALKKGRVSLDDYSDDDFDFAESHDSEAA